MNIHPLLLEKVAQDAVRRGPDALVKSVLGRFVLVARLPRDVTSNPRQTTKPVVGELHAAPTIKDHLEPGMVCWPLKRPRITSARFNIGRDPANDVVIPYPHLSKNHVKITVSMTGATIQDLGSANGTWLRGEALGDKPVTLEDGDVFRIAALEVSLWDSQRMLKTLMKQ